ncbi:MAG: pantoate--beta-alanine ligase [Bacteriovoracaceae bacterium]
MTQLITKTNELLKIRHELKLTPEDSIGFVPTMGNLHQGHLSLIEESLQKNSLTFVSIFVNPKQFAPHEDFNKYPRTLESDLALINSLNSKKPIYVYAPATPLEVFPENYLTQIYVRELTQKLCGKTRPTHFEGVTTVVYRLFSLIRPHNSYFGLKDYQQYLVIQKMVNDLNLPINVFGLPIVREASGLALSSRNSFLSSEGKAAALTLAQLLHKVTALLKKGSFNEALQLAKITCENDKYWDYLEILEADTLNTPTLQTKKFVIAGAYYVEKTRLIDNQLLTL